MLLLLAFRAGSTTSSSGTVPSWLGWTRASAGRLSRWWASCVPPYPPTGVCIGLLEVMFFSPTKLICFSHSTLWSILRYGLAAVKDRSSALELQVLHRHCRFRVALHQPVLWYITMASQLVVESIYGRQQPLAYTAGSFSSAGMCPAHSPARYRTPGTIQKMRQVESRISHPCNAISPAQYLAVALLTPTVRTVYQLVDIAQPMRWAVDWTAYPYVDVTVCCPSRWPLTRVCESVVAMHLLGRGFGRCFGPPESRT